VRHPMSAIFLALCVVLILTQLYVRLRGLPRNKTGGFYTASPTQPSTTQAAGKSARRIRDDT